LTDLAINMITAIVGQVVVGFLVWCYWRKVARVVGLRVHRWTYRNPFSRKCVHCGKCQDQYRSNWEGSNNHSWWETMYPLAHSPDACWNLGGD